MHDALIGPAEYGRLEMAARILVVEDDAASLKLVTYLLGAFGHHALAATDGSAALALARAERPDLILCDIQLPGEIDGYTVARSLKGDPELRSIPLVALTAYAMVGDRERALAAGFDGHISKPLAPERLAEQIRGFLPEGARTTAETADGPQPS